MSAREQDAVLKQHLSFARAGWLLRRLLLRDLRRVSAMAHGRMLDIGCGQSPYRGLFPQLTGYVGIDHPSAYHPEDRPGAWADAMRLPFADGSFDTVLATQILEHVPEPWLLLAEAARVLRPGGVLLLSAPHIWDLHEQPHDYYRYTCYGLEFLLKRAGFEPEQILPQGGFFVTIGQRSSYFVSRIFQKLRLQALGIAGAFVINCAAYALDRIYTYEGETLNYVAAGRKRA